MSGNPPTPNAFDEWQAGYVLGDLSPQELELFSLSWDNSLDPGLESLFRTAAAVHVMYASTDHSEIPSDLRRRIQSQATDHFRTQAEQDTRPVVSLNRDREHRHGLRKRESVAWLVAAASVLMAIGFGMNRFWGNGRPDASPVAFATARSNLLASTTDVLISKWAVGKTPFENEVTGDVVWSNQRQEGYLRFESMPINHPSVEQYQLWIIDPGRDDEPIDGGVFDIVSEGETVIPIDAKLNVVRPAAFAITIEKPGGVVVSTQDRLPLIAMVES